MTTIVDVVEQDSTRIVLRVTGPLDAFTCAPLVEALQRVAGHREVIVDLSRVTHFSAAGVHALQIADQSLAEGGGLLRLAALGTGAVMSCCGPWACRTTGRCG